MTRVHSRIVQVIAVIFSMAAYSLTLRANSSDDAAESVERTFSGSCAQIAYLSDAQRRALTDSRNDENFEQFCFPEDPYECTDYSASVAKFGTLQTNDGGYYCRFVPK